MLHRKHLAGARKTGLHLVSDQKDAVLVAQLPQPQHRLFLDRVETALALHRFKHDGRHARRLDIALEHMVHGPLRLVQRGTFRGERHVVDLGRERTEAGLVGLDLAGERDREQAAAVEGTAKSDHTAAPG